MVLSKIFSQIKGIPEEDLHVSLVDVHCSWKSIVLLVFNKTAYFLLSFFSSLHNLRVADVK